MARKPLQDRSHIFEQFSSSKLHHLKTTKGGGTVLGSGRHKGGGTVSARLLIMALQDQRAS